MATLHDLKSEILKGRRVKREGWDGYVMINHEQPLWTVDILADDWILEPLPKVKKKVKLYAYYMKESLNTGAAVIMFHREYESSTYTRLPNLDQEIEVDE